jgi:glycosyltransferase involved in cell wall biosynthesis
VSPPRVVFFDAYPHVYGGAARMMHVLALGLRERGWRVEVVVPAEGIVSATFRADAVTVTHVPAPVALSVYGGRTTGWAALRAAAALPPYMLRLGRVFRSRADVVQAITQRGVLLAGPAARWARVPLVWGIAGTEPSAAANLIGGVLAHHLIGVSRATLVENRGVPRWRRRTVAPNPFHPRVLDVPPARHRSGAEVVCAARLSPDKGIDVLVRAAAIVRRRVPGLRVTILGSPLQGHEEYAASLQRLRGDLDLDDVVEFAGFVTNPEVRWRNAAVYAQPSRPGGRRGRGSTEGMPLAVAEAMASGLPVVASRLGGLPEMIEDGVHGLLVQPDDEVALAAAVERLLTDRALAARLAAAGRARALAEFSPGQMVDSYAEVYCALTGEINDGPVPRSGSDEGA